MKNLSEVPVLDYKTFPFLPLPKSPSPSEMLKMLYADSPSLKFGFDLAKEKSKVFEYYTTATEMAKKESFAPLDYQMVMYQTMMECEMGPIPPQKSKMDPVLKKKWIEALRSNDYPQARGFLEIDNEVRADTRFTPSLGSTGNGFCCLGVLAKVAGYEYRHGQQKLERGQFGLSDYHQERLMNMNDRQGLSFNLIASYIEENV